MTITNSLLCTLAIAALIMAGCNNKVKQKQLNQISELTTQIDSAEYYLNKADTAGFGAQAFETTQTITQIQKYLKDTLPFETAAALSDYSRVRKNLGKMNANMVKIKNDIEYSRAQLVDLKKDAENGLLADSIFNKYYAEEAKAASDILVNASGLDKWVEFVRRKYKDNKPVADSVAQSLQTEE